MYYAIGSRAANDLETEAQRRNLRRRVERRRTSDRKITSKTSRLEYKVSMRCWLKPRKCFVLFVLVYEHCLYCVTSSKTPSLYLIADPITSYLRCARSHYVSDCVAANRTRRIPHPRLNTYSFRPSGHGSSWRSSVTVLRQVHNICEIWINLASGSTI